MKTGVEEMTKEEFEKKYAKGSGMTLEKLREYGFRAEKCDCEEKGCHGWKMVMPNIHCHLMDRK